MVWTNINIILNIDKLEKKPHNYYLTNTTLMDEDDQDMDKINNIKVYGVFKKSKDSF